MDEDSSEGEMAEAAKGEVPNVDKNIQLVKGKHLLKIFPLLGRKKGRPPGSLSSGIKIPDNFIPRQAKRLPQTSDDSISASPSPVITPSISKKESGSTFWINLLLPL